jgi:hypothetical protein
MVTRRSPQPFPGASEPGRPSGVSRAEPPEASRGSGKVKMVPWSEHWRGIMLGRPSCPILLRTRLGRRATLAGLCLLALSAGAADAAGAAENAANGAQEVPAPPRSLADRFGVYNWGVDYSAWPGTPDKLNWGAGLAAAVGSKTVRVYLGPTDVYGVNPADDPADDLYLQRIVASPGSAYDALFANPAFSTYLLTVFTPGDTGDWWRGGFSGADYASEESQLAALGKYLLGNPRYARKTFILLNWEGDNALSANLQPTAPDYPTDADWAGFTSWAAARAAGVRDARAAVPASTARLYSGLEFNQVDSPDGNRCGTAGEHCVIDRVAPRVDVDYYSYSSWETVNVKVANPAASLRAALAADLGFALSTVRAARPGLTQSNFILGEYGFPRSVYGECTAAAWVRELVQSFGAPGAFQVSYAIFWQVLDNAWRSADGARAVTECGRVDPLLYGLYRGRDLHQTLLGVELAALLRDGILTLPTHCPTLGPGSVLNPAQAYRPVFEAASPLSIFGKSFSGRGDEVWVLQGVSATADHTLAEMSATVNAAGWHDSPHQINATFPPGAEQPGCAMLWTTDARQIDSNSEILSIQPPAARAGDPAGPAPPP